MDDDARFRRVWDILEKAEADRRRWQAEFEARRKKWQTDSDAAAKKSRADSDAAAKKSRADSDAAAKKSRAEFEARMRRSEEDLAKWRAERAKFDAELKKSRADFEARMRRSEEDLAKWRAERADAERRFDKRMDQIAKHIGGFTQNYSDALEEEFIFALEDEMRLGDIPLESVRRLVGPRYEYDIVGINGDCVAVGEIKHKLRAADVVRFAEERLPFFAEEYPGLVKDRRIFGMVGGGSVVAGAQKAAEKCGMFVLRLKNKKLVVDNVRGARPIARH